MAKSRKPDRVFHGAGDIALDARVLAKIDAAG
jgi:hypothetical protein